MAKYDIFISYSTEDYAWVAQLTDELEKRGVRVWIDRNRIRPGDNFAEALERGLESSGAVGLVITPRSIASGWVREEYYRAIALSKTQNLRLIPLLVEDAELPGFLSGRQYVDFCSSDHLDFEDSVSRLIWPGITGKEILIILKDIEILGGIEYGWSHLRWILTEQKVRRNRHTEPDKFETRVTLAIKEGYRVVVIADIFDYWPWRDWRKYGYLTPNDHVQTLFSLRERTRNTPDEIVFVLYHHPDALRRSPHNLDNETLVRLRHYFHLPMAFYDYGYGPDVSTREQRLALLGAWRRLWVLVQQEILNTEGRLA